MSSRRAFEERDRMLFAGDWGGPVEVPCRECGHGHDYRDMFEHDGNLYCDGCDWIFRYEENDDGDDSETGPGLHCRPD